MWQPHLCQIDINILILSLPLFGVDSKSTCLSHGFCIHRPRKYNTICLELIIFWILCFFVVVCLSGWNQWMWIEAYRTEGMVTQGPTPDPKCRWNFPLFLHSDIHQLFPLVLTISYSLCYKSSFWEMGWTGVVYLFSFRPSVFCFVMTLVLLDRRIRAWWLFCPFLCSFIVFFVSGSFNFVLLVHRNCCVCF